MRKFLAAAELERVQQTTGQCTAEARIARQRADKDAHYYRVQAEHFRKLAAGTRWPNVQATRLRIANSYERLAESARRLPELGGEAIHQGQRPTDDVQSARTGLEDRTPAPSSTAADPLVSARVYPANARLEPEIAKLSSEDRQVASAALIAMSRALCEIAVVHIRETGERLRRSG